MLPGETVNGLRFMPNDAGKPGEYRHATPTGTMLRLSQLSQAVDGLSGKTAKRIQPRQLQWIRVDEAGAHLSADGTPVTARVVLLASPPALATRRLLNLPDWELGNSWRVAIEPLAISGVHLPADGLVPMSLDLLGQGFWGYLHWDQATVQLMTMQPAHTAARHPAQLVLAEWRRILVAQHVIAERTSASSAAEVMDLPLAGALQHESVGNRTLLIGPAGGFYSACGEDVYPTCWSAVCAAKTAVAALQERHVQDALQAYRQAWGGTLGDYLRGPQQNLRFLLPLIYRNPVMSARMAEAVLFGDSVVR
jgi:flavin-dependent dehydrogenase